MKYMTLIVSSLLFLLLTSCEKKKEAVAGDDAVDLTKMEMKGDRTVLGLACEGCSDSVIYLLPADISDPVRYDVVAASRNNRVMGTLKVGDKIAVMVNERDSTVADLVINVDELKGSWCYIVLPKMKAAT